MPRPSPLQRLATVFARPAVYVRRLRRGLTIMQQLGRLELFRVEARMALGRLDYPHEDIYLRIDSRYAPTRLKSCAKEPWTVRWLEEVVVPGEIVYDIGANVGAYSLIAAKLGNQVVAIEPAYATFAALCENIIVNDVVDSVYPLGITLGGDTSLGFFNYHDVASGAALHSTGERPFLDGRVAPVYRQPVLVFRLDDLVEEFSLPRANHLKVDVDGAELDVLTGAERTLRSSELRSVMVEVNEEETEAITALLGQAGLELDARHDPTTALGHWYGLFVRPDGTPR